MTGTLTAVLNEVKKGAAVSFDAPPGAAGSPRLEVARSFVRSATLWVGALNSAVGAQEDLRLSICSSVLHAAYPVLLPYRHGRGARARELLSWLWASHAAAFGLIAPIEVEALLPSPPIERMDPSPDDQEYLEVLRLAVDEYLRDVQAGNAARHLLRGLLVTLAISTEDLGRLFRVSGETARRWEQGVVTIPAKHQAEITLAGDALKRLRSMFQPERLPAVIRRRPAPLFDGESALDWILRGRIRQVVDRYDRLLAYEPELLQNPSLSEA